MNDDQGATYWLYSILYFTSYSRPNTCRTRALAYRPIAIATLRLAGSFLLVLLLPSSPQHWPRRSAAGSHRGKEYLQKPYATLDPVLQFSSVKRPNTVGEAVPA